MLYSMAFIVLFAVGGLTGIVLANPGVNYQVHNTGFLVAHFHNMLIPGLLYGMLAGYNFWFPKAFGFRLNQKWGVISFGCWVSGFLLAFMPLYALGAMGLPRRSDEYFEAAYLPWTIAALFGAVLVLAAMASLVVQLLVSIKHRELNSVPIGDPWNGRSLEWATPSPPPDKNFAVVPTVAGRNTFMYTSSTPPPTTPQALRGHHHAAQQHDGRGRRRGRRGRWVRSRVAHLVDGGGRIAAGHGRRDRAQLCPQHRARYSGRTGAARNRGVAERGTGRAAATREEEMTPANHGLAEAAAA